MIRPLLALLFSGIFAQAAEPRRIPASGPWELQDGDRVVFLGDAFLEREGNYGFIETYLSTAFAQKNVTFRNLAWSGDTPKCESRSYFGPPEEGFTRLKSHLEMIKPTVIIIGYGATSAQEGAKGLAPFIESYQRLLDMIQKTTSAGVALLSPVPGDEKGPLEAQLKARNRALAEYGTAIRKLAAERGVRYVDLAPGISVILKASAKPLTAKGIHFTEEGYRAIAPVVAAGLGFAQKGSLPESLRASIQAKNQLFFYRWRPQNETYLFGFRKHEQGNNAVEIPQFDPLINAREKEIAALRTQSAAP